MNSADTWEEGMNWQVPPDNENIVGIVPTKWNSVDAAEESMDQNASGQRELDLAQLVASEQDRGSRSSATRTRRTNDPQTNDARAREAVQPTLAHEHTTHVNDAPGSRGP